MAVSTDLLVPSAYPNANARPFVKWVGGKRGLMHQYEAFFPEEFGGYHEPFVGGGAVFFHLQPEAARLSDVNGRLIETYRAVRDDLPGLVDRLETHRERYSEDYFYQARERFNQRRGLTALDRAALFIFLNKTCFNGLYRENKRGNFNAPWGRRKNAPAMYDLPSLVAASGALQDVDLLTASFERVLDDAVEGDLVYFDPPYVPLSATSSFTSYAKGGFDDALQIRLAQIFDKLARRGCYVMLSNSDCDVVRELYAGWRIETVYASRAINSKGDGRGRIPEVLVCSW